MNIISEQEIQTWIENHELAILFFKTNGCGVCQVQLDKLQSIVENHELDLKVINISKNPHLASSQMVLSAPVTKVFYQGREMLKEGAYVDFNRLQRLLKRVKEEV